MPTYNFKKESKLFVVYGGLRYTLDIYPDISFSQTFNETAVPVKTIHQQGLMFEKAVITKASPANFNFTIPILRETDMKIVYDLLIDYDTTNVEKILKTADLYVVSNTEIYKLEKCVFENGVFQIVKDKVLSLAITGTASKLSKFTGTLPGTAVARSSTRTFNAPTVLEVTLDSSVLKYISSVSVEITNDTSWLAYDTVHVSQTVSNAAGSMYPSAFFIASRRLSGSVVQHITNETDTAVNTWSTASTLRIRTGYGSYILDFNMPEIVFTNRIDPQDIYQQSFDYRLTSSPAALSDIVKIGV